MVPRQRHRLLMQQRQSSCEHIGRLVLLKATHKRAEPERAKQPKPTTRQGPSCSAAAHLAIAAKHGPAVTQVGHSQHLLLLLGALLRRSR